MTKYSAGEDASLPALLAAYLLLLHLPDQGLKTAHKYTHHTPRDNVGHVINDPQNAKTPTSAAFWHGPASRNRAIRKYSSGVEGEEEDGELR